MTTGRKSSTTRGFRKRDWREESILRDAHGRFRDKPDQPKPTAKNTSTTPKVSKSDAANIAKTTGKLVTKATEYNRIQRERLEVLASLGREQRRRLIGVLKTRTPPIRPTVVLPTARPTVARRSKVKLEVTADGVKVNKGEAADTFRVVTNSSYNYSVKHNGTDIVLNNHKTELHFMGERVKGVPKYLGDDLSKIDNTKLVDSLKFSHEQTRKGNAPIWDKTLHGEPVTDNALIRKGGYQEMQIHHVGQWAKDRAESIESDYSAGRITETERERRHFSQMFKEDGKWKLVTASQSEREFVILPNGLHAGGAPLYLANHPMFLNPDTKKLDKIGIKEKGDGGREWFEGKFRGKFWKQYWLHTTKELATEATRRIKAGELDHNEVKTKLGL